MSKHNLRSVSNKHSKVNILLGVFFLFLIFILWSAVFIANNKINTQLVNNQLSSEVSLNQKDLSEKLSIVASTKAFREYLQNGDNSKTDAYYRFLNQLVTLKDQSIVGTIIHYKPSPYLRGMEARNTKLIFSHGQKTPYYVTLKLCYLNSRLDAKLGLCQNTWTLYFSKPALLHLLKNTNKNIITCKNNCHKINLLPKHYFGSFPVVQASSMIVHLNLRQDTTISVFATATIGTILLLILLSIIIVMRNRQMLKRVFADPLHRTTAALTKGKTPDTTEDIDEIVLINRAIKKGYETKGKIERAKIAQQTVHDIRSPLIAILGILSKTNTPDEEQVGTIKSAAQQMNNTLNNMVQKNIGSASINYEHLHSVMLIPIIRYVLSEKKSTLEAMQRSNIEIKTIIDKNAYKAFVNIIPETFKRILSNIVNNAIEALKDRENPEITLQISVDREINEVVVAVIDNGCGIPKEYLSSIFEEGATFNKEDGTGLGLYHAKENIERWHGSITVTSTFNQGTTVTLRIAKQPPAVWFGESLTLLPHTKVVIVDDSKTFHNEWMRRMKDVGVNLSQILHYYNPNKFFDWYKAHPYEDSADYVYLIDQEFAGVKTTGLDLIKSTYARHQCFLVTTYSEDFALQNACEELHIKLIPKQYVAYMPIHIVKKLANIILLMKNHTLGEAWEYRLTKLGKSFQCYYSISNFMTDLRLYPIETKIFIVDDFDSIILKVSSLGYKDTTVLTHNPENCTVIDGVKTALKEFSTKTFENQATKTTTQSKTPKTALKELRKNLYLSEDKLAKLAGFESSKPITNYEIGDTNIPDKIRDCLVALDEAANNLAELYLQETLRFARDTHVRTKNYPPVPLLVYSSDSDLSYADAETYQKLGCHEVHRAAMERVRQKFNNEKFQLQSEIITFDKVKYQTWLTMHSYKHNQEHRIEWTNEQISKNNGQQAPR
jgi:signal transduction histidine kinase